MVSPKILIVEDEMVVARDVQVQLQDMGYQVVGHATRSEDAIALAGQLRPHMVLMDIQLAGAMDGVSAAQSIRDQFGVPVIFLTAFTADDILARAKMAEPYGYILKPFSERELKTVMEMALYKHQTELRLHEVALHNQIILDNMLDGVITISESGLIESFNRAACRIFGYAAADVIGRNVSMLMPEPHSSRHNTYLQHFNATGESRVMGMVREVQGLRKDGSLFPMTLSVSSGMQGNRVTFIGLVHDQSEHQQDMEEIRRLAFYDALTGLPNRRLLMDRLQQAMLASARTG
nr:PAS domain S-box protein [uncultured Rhodoferax sp.]